MTSRVEETLWAIARECPSPGTLGQDGCMASGEAGLAVFYAHLFRFQGTVNWRDRALDHLHHAQRALAERPLPPGLFGGFLGIGWAHGHVGQVLGEWGEEDALVEMDHLVIALLARNRPLPMDLISGLAGFGVYGLHRLATNGSQEPLAGTLIALEKAATKSAAGAAWLTRPDHLPDHQRIAAPQGYFNLGMAHGAPAAIAVLGQALAAGVETTTTRQLYGEAVRWLLAQKNPSGEPGGFGPWVVAGLPGESRWVESDGWTRIAWCYGDLGLGTGLLLAAKAAGDPSTEIRALEICRHAATRPLHGSGLMDGGLCHGAAGTAHLFQRLFQATGDDLFLQAAEAHLGWLLQFRQTGTGIGGFRRWHPNSESPSESWQTDPGFLEGASGIGLALLAFLCTEEPTWDAVLLANLQAGGRP